MAAERLVKLCSKGNALGVFVSDETVGTGSEQDIAHGLGVIPDYVAIVLTEFGASENPNVTEGTHDATNVKVTVASATVKFKVLAIALQRVAV